MPLGWKNYSQHKTKSHFNPFAQSQNCRYFRGDDEDHLVFHSDGGDNYKHQSIDNPGLDPAQRITFTALKHINKQMMQVEEIHLDITRQQDEYYNTCIIQAFCFMQQLPDFSWDTGVMMLKQ